ncbi:MAG TPA: glycerol-3-phosphate 1-O-acyltransferase PlsY [Bryobacteraceae bacterium]|nr:glycerol-3-phosphate 1-O-acyltransferase PlsY [Bryobacteraceae bacterium]
MGPVPQLLLVSAVAYLVGGLPFGYWFVRLTSGKDIRTMGSGNIGATNVHRTQGGKAGVIVLLLDILKGFIAVFIGALVAPNNATALGLSAVFVMLGHCYPVFLRFKGGKAVACFVGAFLYIAPVALGIVLLLFVAIVALWKYISLASIAGALIFPLVFWIIYRPAIVLLVACICCSLLIIYRHKGNIARLRNGKENVFSLKGGKA